MRGREDGKEIIGIVAVTSSDKNISSNNSEALNGVRENEKEHRRYHIMTAYIFGYHRNTVTRGNYYLRIGCHRVEVRLRRA